jgi:hypothetical protein
MDQAPSENRNGWLRRQVWKIVPAAANGRMPLGNQEMTTDEHSSCAEPQDLLPLFQACVAVAACRPPAARAPLPDACGQLFPAR